MLDTYKRVRPISKKKISLNKRKNKNLSSSKNKAIETKVINLNSIRKTVSYRNILRKLN